MVFGLLGAFGAAVLYGAGSVLQAAGVRRGTAARGTLAARIWQARVYGIGLALDGLGFLASVAALRSLPLFVVESAIASSVAVTALLSVLFLGARLNRSEILALAAVGAGLVALAVSAAEGPAVALEQPGAWLLLALALPLVGLAVAGARSTGPAGGALLAVSAGLGFGGVGVAARVWVAPDPVWRVVLDPVSLALAVYAVIALVCFGLALQRGSVTTAAAITFTVETVVPAAVGLVWLGDRIRPGLAGLAAAGFLLTLGGCVALARYAGEPD